MKIMIIHCGALSERKVTHKNCFLPPRGWTVAVPGPTAIIFTIKKNFNYRTYQLNTCNE